jgi:hypothetical protein
MNVINIFHFWGFTNAPDTQLLPKLDGVIVYFNPAGSEITTLPALSNPFTKTQCPTLVGEEPGVCSSVMIGCKPLPVRLFTKLNRARFEPRRIFRRVLLRILDE